MLVRNVLEVRPVRRYPEPLYPAARDFYGFSSGPTGLARHLASPTLASVLVASVFGSGCERQPAGPAPLSPEPAPVVDTTPEPPLATTATTDTPGAAETPDAAAAEAPPKPEPNAALLPPIDRKAILAHKGPFSWTASALPIGWMPYGTGAPARLSEEKVRQTVERLFAQAGIRLRRDVAFTRPGIACELDGYDARKRIGYEFVYWPDIEDPQGFPGNKEGDRSKMLSHDEIQRIMQLELEGKERIAIISFQDSRFSYGGFPQRGTTEATALQALSANLSKYIAWLRSQGAL